MNRILQFFDRPFPRPRTGWRGFYLSVAFGFFIALFLAFFQPFDINLVDDRELLGQVTVFGGITFTFFFLFSVILPRVLPKWFQDSRWTIGSTILYYLPLLLIIATLNGLYINYTNDYPFRWSRYWWIISRTIALGGIPLSLIWIYDSKYPIRSTKKAESPSEAPTTHERLFRIQPANRNGVLELSASTFRYAKAESNYVTIYQQEKRPSIHRITLRELEAQLRNSPFVRCHRSYLINLLAVQQLRGNAQGGQVYLEEVEAPIPVSRKYIRILQERHAKVSAC